MKKKTIALDEVMLLLLATAILVESSGIGASNVEATSVKVIDYMDLLIQTAFDKNTTALKGATLNGECKGIGIYKKALKNTKKKFK